LKLSKKLGTDTLWRQSGDNIQEVEEKKVDASRKHILGSKMGRVEFVWDGQEWVIKGDKNRLCEFVDMKCQTCLINGHSCLTPDPDICPSHSLNFRERLGDNFVNKLIKKLSKLR
jgi:hypothetical protein